MEEQSNGKGTKSNVLLTNEGKPVQVEEETKTRVNSCPKCGMEPFADCVDGFRPVLRECEIRGSWYLCENLKKHIALELLETVSLDANEITGINSSDSAPSEDENDKESAKKH